MRIKIVMTVSELKYLQGRGEGGVLNKSDVFRSS